jgi:hypothetical protein
MNAREAECMLDIGWTEGKRPIGRPKRRWLNTIKMDLREPGLSSMDWIGLVQDRD